MAGVSASHLILFIASVLIAASVAGVFTNTVGRLSEAISEQGLDVAHDVRTDVEIISDSGSDAIYDENTNVTVLYIKNTGSGSLPPTVEFVDVFVDGRYQTDVNVTLIGPGDLWYPGDVIRLEIPESLSSGDHRIKIVVDGDSEVFEFRS